jgi:hypothetical protein
VRRLAGVQEGVPVGAEDVVFQEPGEAAEEVVLADSDDSGVRRAGTASSGRRRSRGSLGR